jgi:hypothetical protein
MHGKTAKSELAMEFMIGTVVGIVGLAITYLAYRAQTASTFKRLQYTGLAMDLINPLVNDELRNHFKVYLKNQELINPVACIARIQNTGKAPILPSDFDGPLTIQSAEEAAIFRGGVIDCNPPNIFDPDRPESFSFQVKQNKFMIGPFLLNPDDRIQVTYVADMAPETWDVEVKCRIVGIKQVMRLPLAKDSFQQTVSVEPIQIPGNEASGNFPPDPNQLSLVVFVGPMLMNIGEGFSDEFCIKVGNEFLNDPHLAYITVTNGREKAYNPNGSSLLSIDFGGTEITRLIAYNPDIAADEHDGTAHDTAEDRHKVFIRLPHLDPGESIRVAGILSASCDNPGFEFHDFMADHGMFMRFTTHDPIKENLAQMHPKILLSNQKLYRGWQRLRDRYQWIDAYTKKEE